MGARGHEHRGRLLVALALFVLVTVLRFAVASDTRDGIALLYTAPVAVLALTYGVRGGLAGSAVGFGLFVVWVLVEGVSVGVLGYVTRAAAIAVIGGVAGFLSDQQAQVGRTNTRWFEMSNDLLVEADLKGYFTRLNGQWERLLGWTTEELMSRPMVEFVHPDDVAATTLVADDLSARPGEVFNFENRYRTKDGSWKWLMWNVRSDGHRKYAVARDITARKALEEERQALFDRAEAMSRTDALTGLPNRRSWEEEVQHAIARAERQGGALALAIIDLDHFKRFNDTHGHQAGDLLLADVAAAWRLALRATDFLARYGGEEFALLLPDCEAEEAEGLLDRLRACMPMDQTCSVGVAHWDRRESVEELVGRADAALYEAKRIGRDRVVSSG